MHSDVWDEVADKLAAQWRVHLIDLPGHGRSDMVLDHFELKKLAKLLARSQPRPAVWLGWSLGGLVATQVALHFPELVRALVLVASTPQFVRSDDWPHAMAPEVLAQFAQELEQDYRATVKKFLTLQAMGSERAREEVRDLRARLFRHGEPDLEALRGGLQLLQQENLRPQLSQLRCPVCYLMGSHDTLAPARMLDTLTQQHPQIQHHVIQGAGHSPFISHPDQFIEVLQAFLETC
jgi:pimeloyl-[acyl-carrier protein] methyl ester esterase